MSDYYIDQMEKNLNINDENDAKLIQKICYALSSPERIKIMQALSKNKNLATLSKELNIPLTSLSRHVDALADAKLINLYYQPGIKGHTKHISRSISQSMFSYYPISKNNDPQKVYSVELPIGMFSHCHIERPCGMLGKDRKLIPYDTPSYFFNPERSQAECLWFDKGFISYNFPSPPLELIKNLNSIEFSFEICSETEYYNNNWPSDITVCVNKIELFTFTSPGDFGGRRGKYTPEFWPVTSTQFGRLKRVVINDNGVYCDNELVNSKLNFSDLNLFDGNAIQLTIGIKDDAVHKGGINLFGKNFGDFPQSIVMNLFENPANKKD